MLSFTYSLSPPLYIFNCRVTDFNLARLVHGDMRGCVIPPTASAVVKLLEKLGTSNCLLFIIFSNSA